MLRKIHRASLILIFGSLFALPLFQWIFPFMEEPELGGAATPIILQEANRETLWSGQFSKNFENWFGENFGFRKVLVKVEKQLNYSVFGNFPKMYKGRFVVGKDAWLFQTSELQRSVEDSVLDEGKVRIVASNLKRLQDHMDAYNVPLILIIAPIKSHIHPEKIPDSFHNYSRSENLSTYARVRPILDEYGIRYFDGIKEAERLLNKKPDFQIFAPEGTHWTYAYAAHCIDRITEQMNPLMKCPIPSFSISYDRTEASFWTESDLRAGANLTYSKHQNTAIRYPTLSVADKTTQRPRITFVADSYGWTMINCLNGDFGGEPLVESVDMYYYFNSLHAFPGSKKTPFERKTFDLTQDILTDKDALWIISSEESLFDIGFGFVEAAFKNID